MRPLRIAIADPSPETRDNYKRIVTELGHTVICEASSGRELVDQCCKEAIELVIAEVALDDLDGIDAAIELSRLSPTAFILATTFSDDTSIQRATGDHVMSYLIKPVKDAELAVSVPLARSRFEQWKALHSEHYDAQTAMRDRELIDRAKAILMKRLSLPEDKAYRRLQELSWTKNVKMAKLAEMVVISEEASKLDGLSGARGATREPLG